MKRALITGITGQDGAYLAKSLLDKGYKVYGIYRRLSTPNFWRLQYLDVFDRVHLVPGNLVDAGSIIEALRTSRPEIGGRLPSAPRRGRNAARASSPMPVTNDTPPAAARN